MPDDTLNLGESPVASPELAPSEVTKLLQADLDAITLKVSLGKPLTEPEIRRLKASAAAAVENKGQTPIPGVEDDAGPKWVESQIDLAKALGVERRTIQRHLKSDGNPGRLPDGRYNLHEWRAWLRYNGKKGGKSLDKNSLECKRIVLDIERREFELGVERAKFSLNADIEQWFGEFAYTMRQLLDALPGQLAPDVVALTIPEAETLIRKAVEKIKDKIATGEWKPAPKVLPSKA